MLHRIEFHAMGCEILAAMDVTTPGPQFSKVPHWFETWEQALSRFRFDSELTHLNQTHEIPVTVSQTLWDVLQTAHCAETLTDGLVTPTVLKALIEAGYDRSFDELPALQTAAMPATVRTASPALMAIAFDEKTRSITLPYGTGLDFGGVAKGWAAHQAMQRLQAEGPVLVDAGGDIAISGSRADRSPWLIGIADPFHPGREIEILGLRNCGVATSGLNRRQWLRAGSLQHHLINPFTSRPAETDLVTVTVVAPTVMEAEAAAKAAFILGSQDGLAWIEARPQFAAVFILENGQLRHSSQIHKYLQ